jgi:hypothetical protein
LPSQARDRREEDSTKLTWRFVSFSSSFKTQQELEGREERDELPYYNCASPPQACVDIFGSNHEIFNPSGCCQCLEDYDVCPQECTEVPEMCHGVLTCDDVCSEVSVKTPLPFFPVIKTRCLTETEALWRHTQGKNPNTKTGRCAVSCRAVSSHFVSCRVVSFSHTVQLTEGDLEELMGYEAEMCAEPCVMEMIDCATSPLLP